MKLIDERLEALRTGDVVRIPVPELGGEVLMILAMPDESTEQVLEETLQDLRDQRAVVEYASHVISRTVADDQAG